MLSFVLVGFGGASPTAAVAPRTVRLAVIPLTFLNDTRSPGDLRRIGNHLFNVPDTDGVDRSVAAYYADASYGRMRLTGRIFPTVAIPDTSAGCESDWGENGFLRWGLLARTAVEARGDDLSGFDTIAYLWPHVFTCGFGGKASLIRDELYLNLTPTYWSSATSWVYNWYVVTHELGHTFGARHAGAVYCTNSAGKRVSLGGTCRETLPITDSYDPFDMMLTYYPGWAPAWSKRLPSVYHRALMGFVDPSEIRSLTAPGTYEVDLNPAEFATSVTKEIVVTRPLITPASPATSAGGRQLCLEWHRPKGWFNDFSAASSVANGLLIRVCDPGTGRALQSTRLVDTRPGSYSGAADWKDAPLTVGRTFTDWFSRVTITVVSRTLSSTPAKSRLRVRIVIPAFPVPSPTPAPSPTPLPTPDD